MSEQIDKHLEDIQHGSDFARSMQLLCYSIAVLFALVGAADFAFDWVKDRSWLSLYQTGVQFYFAGYVLGYFRKVTLTLVTVVKELQTTI